jgi:hypothetical protein
LICAGKSCRFVELIKEHNQGASKYESLGYHVPDYKGVSDELLEKYKNEIEKEVRIPTEICKV